MLKKSLWFVSLVVVLGLCWSSATAEPQPPKVVVNHDTQECGEIFGGDECMDCFPTPEGWEVLGYAFEVECPEGYAVVEVDYDCQAFKDQFCCSEGHSGADGDCEDLVVNREKGRCAFVDEIAGCNLPQGWQPKPDDVSAYDWTCPNVYTWMDPLACLAEPDEAESDETHSDVLLVAALVMGLLVAGGLFALIRRRQSGR